MLLLLDWIYLTDSQVKISERNYVEVFKNLILNLNNIKTVSIGILLCIVEGKLNLRTLILALITYNQKVTIIIHKLDCSESVFSYNASTSEFTIIKYLGNFFDQTVNRNHYANYFIRNKTVHKFKVSN